MISIDNINTLSISSIQNFHSSDCLLPSNVHPANSLNSEFSQILEDQPLLNEISSGNKVYYTTHGILQKYNIISKAGNGGFGSVFLARDKFYNEYVAIKRILKSSIESFPSRLQDLNEIKVQQLIGQGNHRCYSKLISYTDDNQFVYLILNFIPGGDVYSMLSALYIRSIFEIKQFFAEVIVLLVGLHSKGISYRDLKPENIMFDSDGHLVLIDFGLSLVLGNGSTMECTGTPDYMSPEQCCGIEHSMSTDWWSFGVLIFEILTGISPFSGDTFAETKAKVLHTAENGFSLNNYLNSEISLFRSKFSETEVKLISDLIQRLLVNEKDRLGSGTRGYLDIMEHPFFEGVDWKSMCNRVNIFLPEYPSSQVNQISAPYENFNFNFEYKESFDKFIPSVDSLKYNTSQNVITSLDEDPIFYIPNSSVFFHSGSYRHPKGKHSFIRSNSVVQNSL